MPGPPLVLWPPLEDFEAWLGPDNMTTPDAEARASVAFYAAWHTIYEKLNPDLLPESAYPTTIIHPSDPPEFDSNGQQTYTVEAVAVPDETCTPAVVAAIFLQAGRYFIRRDSLNGVLAFAEYGVRLAKLDPDVEAMIADLVGGAEP
jgi:hypothetical protein